MRGHHRLWAKLLRAADYDVAADLHPVGDQGVAKLGSCARSPVRARGYDVYLDDGFTADGSEPRDRVRIPWATLGPHPVHFPLCGRGVVVRQCQTGSQQSPLSARLGELIQSYAGPIWRRRPSPPS
jgi:hypothetical protein